jgi:hypothetical protein
VFTLRLCVLYLSGNNLQLLPDTSSNDFFSNWGGECLLRGTPWVFILDRMRFVFKRLMKPKCHADMLCFSPRILTRTFPFTNQPALPRGRGCVRVQCVLRFLTTLNTDESLKLIRTWRQIFKSLHMLRKCTHLQHQIYQIHMPLTKSISSTPYPVMYITGLKAKLLTAPFSCKFRKCV